MTKGTVFRNFRAWERPAWMRKAACARVGFPEWWFPGERGTDSNALVAKQICYTCPVRQQCLEFAIKNREYGIWGGLTETERHPPRKRRGRPPAST
jgi:WhiB family redox-sensing transcriptional regulator